MLTGSAYGLPGPVVEAVTASEVTVLWLTVMVAESVAFSGAVCEGSA